MKDRFVIPYARLAVGVMLLLPVAKEGHGQPAPAINWQHLSTHLFELQFPGSSLFQSASVVADFDQDGVNDFAIGVKTGAPSVVWYRRLADGWAWYPIEQTALPIENGGAVYDIDGDGYPDLVLGGDARSNELWWWENPYPNYDPRTGWRRHIIKRGGQPGHLDQMFGDFKGTGHPQLVFWNQGARALFLAEIPRNPRTADVWACYEILSSASVGPGPFAISGLAAADVDGDGKLDIIAGNHWLKYETGNTFKATRFAPAGGRVAAGNFQPGALPQIIVAVPDDRAPLRYYEATGNPTDPKNWVGHDLLNRPLLRCNTLQVADINGDGHLDIFAGEMAKWTEDPRTVDNAQAVAVFLFGDGHGQFRASQFLTGFDFHEAKVADLDGDGDMDILYKPYRLDAPRLDVWLQNGTAGRVAKPLQHFTPPVGVALNSVSSALRTNLAATLATIARAGATQVEVNDFHGLKAPELRKQLDAANLKCVAVSFPHQRFVREFEAVTADAKALGAEYLICADLPRKERLAPADVSRAVFDFNQWSLRLHAVGLQFCYRINGDEFIKTPGSTLLGELITKTKGGGVGYVISVPTLVNLGRDPIELLHQYPGRFPIVHLFDGQRQPLAAGASNTIPTFASVALGKGQLNILSLLVETARAGVKQFELEDLSPQALGQIPVSLQYIREARLPNQAVDFDCRTAITRTL